MSGRIETSAFRRNNERADLNVSSAQVGPDHFSNPRGRVQQMAHTSKSAELVLVMFNIDHHREYFGAAG